MSQSQIYAGLMSGTSADAIDAVLVDFSTPTPRLLQTYTEKLTAGLTHEIHALSLPSTNEIDRMGDLDVRLGRLFAETLLALVKKSGVAPNDIKAVGSHGQTIRHRPPPTHSNPFSLQIGDPNLIAEITGITTVADFRRRDMAVGGQGAPLVPIFHRYLFADSTKNRAVVNIGGMANISCLPKEGQVIGFDTGPGNVLLDAWIKIHTQETYDQNGNWARTGKLRQDLLNELLKHPFFQQPHPKSTGRESFNMEWLQGCLGKSAYPAEDVQKTLVTLTARSVIQAIEPLTKAQQITCDEIIVCGGGAYNSVLMDELRTEADLVTLNPQSLKVLSSQDLGIAPEWIEAMAFAWLAKQTLEHNPGNLRQVTGAQREVILGGIYIAR